MFMSYEKKDNLVLSDWLNLSQIKYMLLRLTEPSTWSGYIYVWVWVHVRKCALLLR